MTSGGKRLTESERLVRFDARVSVQPDGCWIWTAARNNKGYGRMHWWVDGRVTHRLTHRISYARHRGPIPAGLQLDHLCRNRACCNPAHLEPVTESVNTLRGNGPAVQRARWLSKTHCPQGHAYDAANTYFGKKGNRVCRACSRDRMRVRRAVQSSALA